MRQFHSLGLAKSFLYSTCGHQMRTSLRSSRAAIAMPPSLSYTQRRLSMPPQKMKRITMRKWLENLLNKEDCMGFAWKDKSKLIFTVAWRHASRHGFNSSDGDVFIRWARHTGKLKSSGPKETKYYSCYKSNFRSALHSLRDCEEITLKGESKGEAATKTFRFIDPPDSSPRSKGPAKTKRTGKKRVKKEEPESLEGSVLEEVPKREDPPEEYFVPGMEHGLPDALQPEDAQAQALVLEAFTPFSEVGEMVNSSNEIINEDGIMSSMVSTSKMTTKRGSNGIVSVELLGYDPDVDDKWPHDVPNNVPDFKALGIEPVLNLTHNNFMSGGSVSKKREVENVVTVDASSYLRPDVEQHPRNVDVQPEPSAVIDIALETFLWQLTQSAHDDATLSQINEGQINEGIENLELDGTLNFDLPIAAEVDIEEDIIGNDLYSSNESF